MICFGENCEFFHPKHKMKRNVCRSWKINGDCPYRNRCKFFHPIICEEKNCGNKDCNLFHVGGHHMVPMRTTIISFAKDNNQGIQHYVDNLLNHMKYPEYHQIMLTQLVKHYNFDILSNLFEVDENYKRLSRKVDYNIFTSLVWPKVDYLEKHHIDIVDSVRSIFELLVSKKFKIFNENNKFDGETFLNSLLHKDNPLDNDQKMKLYQYFTEEWENEQYCFEIFNNVINILNVENMHKNAQVILFLSFRYSKILLKMLFNKIIFIFSDEVKLILDVLMTTTTSDSHFTTMYFKKNNVTKETFLRIIIDNIFYHYNEYIKSEKFLDMIYDSDEMVEKNKILGNIFQLFGYLFKKQDNVENKTYILSVVYTKLSEYDWNLTTFTLFDHFMKHSEIVINKYHNEIFKKMLLILLHHKEDTKQIKFKFEQTICKFWNGQKKEISDKEYSYLKYLCSLKE
jgi:hypothetical protein